MKTVERIAAETTYNPYEVKKIHEITKDIKETKYILQLCNITQVRPLSVLDIVRVYKVMHLSLTNAPANIEIGNENLIMKR